MKAVVTLFILFIISVVSLITGWHPVIGMSAMCGMLLVMVGLIVKSK